MPTTTTVPDRPRTLVTAVEMARRVAMTPAQFDRMARRLGLPKVKLGHRTVRYSPEDVLEHLALYSTR